MTFQCLSNSLDRPLESNTFIEHTILDILEIDDLDSYFFPYEKQCLKLTAMLRFLINVVFNNRTGDDIIIQKV